jgi:hypothetical protein
MHPVGDTRLPPTHEASSAQSIATIRLQSLDGFKASLQRTSLVGYDFPLPSKLRGES